MPLFTDKSLTAVRVNDQGVTCKWRLPRRNLVSRFISNESGATAIEYGLIAAGIAVAIIAAVQSVGTALNANLGASAKAINP